MLGFPCLLRVPPQALRDGDLFRKLKPGRKEPSRSFWPSISPASPKCPAPITVTSAYPSLPLCLGSSGLSQLCWAKRPQGPRPPSCPAASSQEGACLCCVGHNDNGGQLTSAPGSGASNRHLGAAWAGCCWLSTMVTMEARRSGPAPAYELAFPLEPCLGW